MDNLLTVDDLDIDNLRNHYFGGVVFSPAVLAVMQAELEHWQGKTFREQCFAAAMQLAVQLEYGLVGGRLNRIHTQALLKLLREQIIIARYSTEDKSFEYDMHPAELKRVEEEGGEDRMFSILTPEEGKALHDWLDMSPGLNYKN